VVFRVTTAVASPNVLATTAAWIAVVLAVLFRAVAAAVVLTAAGRVALAVVLVPVTAAAKWKRAWVSEKGVGFQTLNWGRVSGIVQSRHVDAGWF
jgi:hypothetical protein